MSDPIPTSPQRFVAVVAGDVIWDCHVYRGTRDKPGQGEGRPTLVRKDCGGATALHRLIEQVLPDSWDAKSGVAPPGCNSPQAVAVWSPFPKKRPPKGKEHVPQDKAWRAAELLGYGSPTPLDFPIPEPNLPKPDLLVLDDAGFKFRLINQAPCWHLPSDGDAWVLLKMSEPIGRGDLWHRLTSPRPKPGEDIPPPPSQISARNFVCVISAHDLRREAVAVRRGLSWEQTVGEVHQALRMHPVLRDLGLCRHLIVVFSADGALWVETVNGVAKATLVFDPAGYEGCTSETREGVVVGAMMTMTAALAKELADHIASRKSSPPEIASGIRSGLTAMRGLLELGHGIEGKKAPSGYPYDRIAASFRSKTALFASASVPWPMDQPLTEGWTIAETSEHPPDVHPPLGTMGLARTLAIYGEGALKKIPHARFGDLLTVDRTEIEALRNIRRTMQEYDSSKPKRPLSIGVFGPPGAGKSFGVKEVCKELLGTESWLEFNLSQFSDERDLRGAFHRTRDVGLAGATPVVFWDEFDSSNYKWLRHLLAPMQDGRFQDQQLTHAVGKAIFVFAGGTSERYADFGPWPGDAAGQAEFRLAKGPDFVSRLDAFYDVAGPNRRKRRAAKIDLNCPTGVEQDPTDLAFPLRRALLLRHQLGCKADTRLDFDSDLLDALLLVPEYRHGSRSLEKLVQPLRPSSGSKVVRRSSLPPRTRMDMHVDEAAFHRILARLDHFHSTGIIDSIAADQHADWRKDEENPHPTLDKPFEELEEIDKQNNRAAARRIPEVLALAGLTLSRTPPYRDSLSVGEVVEQIGHHIDRLARAEHEGWVSQRLADGWTYGKAREVDLRKHNMIRDYKDLPSKNQDKDKAAVNAIRKRVGRHGYRVVWLDGRVAD